MIYAYLGGPRSGKTIGEVQQVYRLHEQGWKVFGNLDLTFAEPIQAVDLLDFNMTNAVLVLDEIQTILTGVRRSEYSNMLELFLGQAGKRHIHLIWSTNLSRLTAPTVFDLTDYLIQCYRTGPEDIFKGNGYFSYYPMNRHTGEKYKPYAMSYEVARKYATMYKTEQWILPVERWNTNLSVKDLEKMFADCPTRGSFVEVLRVSHPYITLDKAKAVYDLLKNGMPDRVKSVLRLKEVQSPKGSEKRENISIDQRM